MKLFLIHWLYQVDIINAEDRAEIMFPSRCGKSTIKVRQKCAVSKAHISLKYGYFLGQP